MNELRIIEAAVDQAARRRRWDHAWRGFWKGCLLGACQGLLVLGLYKVLPLPEWSLAASAGLLLLCLAGGWLGGWWRPVTRQETARWIDQHENLQERLSTVLEMSAAPAAAPGWRELVARDAAVCAQALDPRRLLTFRLPRAARWAALALLLGACLGLVPEYRSPARARQQQERELIRSTARSLAAVTRHQLQTRPPELEPLAQGLASITNLAAQLMNQPPAKAEAVRDLSNLTEQLSQVAKEAAENPAIRRMEKTARESAGAGLGASGEAQKQMEALQQALGKAAEKPGELEKMRNDLNKLKRNADKLPDPNTAAGRDAMRQMAQSLSDLAQRAQELGQPLASLEEAIAALQAGNADLFMRDLDAAMTDLNKLSAMANAMQQLQQQQARVGKDLAEQLEKGQVSAAQKTLEKMMKELSAGQCSQAQLTKMLDELKRSVNPASEYAKAADHLKEAIRNLQQKQGTEAVQCLAKASSELDKMLDRMKDCQGLAEALDALKKAQMCLANGQEWGQCQGTCPPRAGQGGKPGRGVGTWTEETGWMYYPQDRAALWDNSGIERPDLDPRGQSERDINRPDNLAPTKIRGQIKPGSSMPSITLRGLSVKGQSNVKFEEAASAAQSEAQSALNQDQVPRAYRGAVRDYFDDLKP